MFTIMKSIFYKICFAILFLFNTQLIAQGDNGLVNWLSIEEAQEKYKNNPKPMLIDIYTDWCGWCKHMMKTTYSNPNLAAYINNFFYPVKFDAETKDTITYNGIVYKPTSKAPKTPHELAIKFLGNNLSYPSTIFVANNYEFNLLSQGYLDDKKIEPLLVFMVENLFKSVNYDDFSKQFNQAFYDTSFVKNSPKYLSSKEIEKLQKKKTKKVLVNIYGSFCNSCKVLNATTLKDTAIANYINKHFYIMNLDVDANDTIIVKGQKYFKTLINGYPMNNFAMKATNGRLSFPTIAVLDSDFNTLDALNAFLTPKSLMPILKYYAEDKYKQMNWNDFFNEYQKLQK
jgi:thioredoxin-related protein